MSTATVRIPDDKRDLLKIIASVEKTEIKQILSELIDEYVERHRETLDLLSKPGWVEAITKGKAEVAKGVKGKRLNFNVNFKYQSVSLVRPQKVSQQNAPERM